MIVDLLKGEKQPLPLGTTDETGTLRIALTIGRSIISALS